MPVGAQRGATVEVMQTDPTSIKTSRIGLMPLSELGMKRTAGEREASSTVKGQFSEPNQENDFAHICWLGVHCLYDWFQATLLLEKRRLYRKRIFASVDVFLHRLHKTNLTCSVTNVLIWRSTSFCNNVTCALVNE